MRRTRRSSSVSLRISVHFCLQLALLLLTLLLSNTAVGGGGGSAFFASALRTTAYPNTALIAGTGLDGSTNGAALGTATISSGSYDIAGDMDGNLYFTDRDQHIIRFYNKQTQMISTIAGNPYQAGNADGVGSGVRLNRPRGIAVSQRANHKGYVYFIDEGNYAVRRLDPVTREVTTIAGGSTTGSYVDGIGRSARFTTLYSIVAAKNSTLYVTEGTSTGYIRKIDLATSRVSTVYRNPYTGGVLGLAMDPVFQSRLFFSTFGGVYSLNVSSLAVTVIDEDHLECGFLTMLVGGPLVYTCASSGNQNYVFIREINFTKGSSTLIRLGNGIAGYVENSEGPNGVSFYGPAGVSAVPLIRAYTQVAVIDRQNNRIRIINTDLEATASKEPTMSSSFAINVSVTASKTLSLYTPPPTIPVTTTTTTTTTTTSTTTTTTTTTAAPTETSRPTDAPYTPAPEGFIVHVRFPNNSLPLINVTADRHNTPLPWLYTIEEAAAVAIEKDVRRALGLSVVELPDPFNESTATEDEYIASRVLLVRNEVRVNSTTGEVMINLQVPFTAAMAANRQNVTNVVTGQVTLAVVEGLYQTIALIRPWSFLEEYLRNTALNGTGYEPPEEPWGTPSNPTGSNRLCAACAGPNCYSSRPRPRCASEDNNGFIAYVAPGPNPCEEWYCILGVFLACFLVGSLIAFVSYRASRSNSRRKGTRTHAIREEFKLQ